MVQVSRRLVVRKEVPVENANELINSLDYALAEHYCKEKQYEKGLQLYRDTLPKLVDTEKISVMNKYLNYSFMYAGSLSQSGKPADAIEVYREMMKYSGFPVSVYKHIGLCMKQMGNADLAIKFLKKFEEISPDKEDVYVYLADITYSDIQDNLKAIDYYEKALEKNPNNYVWIFYA